MYKHQVWFGLHPLQTDHTIVWAVDDFDAEWPAEAHFGVGQLLNHTRIDGAMAVCRASDPPCVEARPLGRVGFWCLHWGI